MQHRILAVIVSAFAIVGSSFAGEGSVKGTVKYNGEPPAPKKIKVAADKAADCKHDEIASEELVVDPATKGIKWAMVRIMGVKAPPPAAPFAEAEIGATGLELLLPLTLKWAEESGVALPAALAKITSDAARILAIDAGHLSPGSAADICVFDPERYWKIAPAALKSQGKNTPFLGLELKGRVRQTLVEGQIVYEAK